MDIESFRDFCLSLDNVSEEFPFGPALVYKVGGKIFTITHMDKFESIALKCDPEEAIELRERYPAVRPGYHLNKKHWNSVDMDNSISDNMLKEWILASYNLVRKNSAQRRKR